MTTTIQKQLAGQEDILFGQGTVVQDRGGTNLPISKVNGAVIPYSGDLATLDRVSINEQIDITAAAIATLASIVNKVADIIAMRLLTPVNGTGYYLNAHTTLGDTGNGDFYGVTGAVIGTYTDDNGTVIVPTGGDGSAAFIRDYTGPLQAAFFGVDPTGATDSLAALNDSINALYPGQSYELGNGTYAVSATWNIHNKYRNKLDFKGVVIPFGAFSDLLVSFDNPAESTVTFITAASFSVVGDRRSQYIVGRSLFVTDAGTSPTVTVATAVYNGTITTVTVTGVALTSPIASISMKDYLIASMAQNLVINNLMVDCQWKSRGVYIGKLYDSSVHNLHVWRPFGVGIRSPMLQEVSFHKPVIFAGIPRTDAVVIVAATWNSATNYAAGVYVKSFAPTYNAGTTYAANDLVTSGVLLYRSIVAGNLGNNPVASPLSWERVEHEYFVSTGLAGNLNKNPNDLTTDWTSRSATPANEFWKPVYVDEAAWEIVGAGTTNTIDNAKVWNFISRSNAHNHIVRIDNPEHSFRPSKIEFYAPQFHMITGVYITAHNLAYGAAGTGETPDLTAPAWGTLLRAFSSTGLKVFGGQLQIGNLAFGKGLVTGTLGVSGNGSRTFLIGAHIETTAAGSEQVGISVLPGVNTAGALNWHESGVSSVMQGTNSVFKVDPKGMTRVHASGTATVLAGTNNILVIIAPQMIMSPRIHIEPTSSLAGLSYWITIGSRAQFTIRTSAAVGANTTFNWEAIVEDA